MMQKGTKLRTDYCINSNSSSSSFLCHLSSYNLAPSVHLYILVPSQANVACEGSAIYNFSGSSKSLIPLLPFIRM